MADTAFFSPDVFVFLRQLKRNNDREWFAKNKARYQSSIVEPALSFIGGFPWTVNPAKEFALMVKYGMMPAQALRSATMISAELLGMQDQIGSLEPGKFADVVAVPSDPMADITQMEKVNFVMKSGAVYKRPE